MAYITYKGEIETVNENPANLIRQGDYIYCDGSGSDAGSFWGIYNDSLKSVITLDGAEDEYIPKLDKIYLYGHYDNWIITKRIKSNKAIVTIEES